MVLTEPLEVTGDTDVIFDSWIDHDSLGNNVRTVLNGGNFRALNLMEAGEYMIEYSFKIETPSGTVPTNSAMQLKELNAGNVFSTDLHAVSSDTNSDIRHGRFIFRAIGVGSWLVYMNFQKDATGINDGVNYVISELYLTASHFKHGFTT